ncbi:MAG: DUF1501 domain-containing protein [Myxococcota bacterium]
MVIGLSAGAVAARLFPAPRQRAATTYAGPLLVSIHASGGWDPIFFCDPKPDPALNRVSQAVGNIGPFHFSDHAVDPVAFGYDVAYTEQYAALLLSNRTFFERHGARTTVFNGVDTRTNSHDTGTRFTWSGKSDPGFPALGALVAAMATEHGDTPPLAFLSSGGFDDPAGLVPLSRASSSGAMRKLMYPNAMDPNKPEDAGYHAGFAWDAIQKAQAARLAAQSGQATLPTTRRALAELAAGRASMGELAALEIPPLIDIPGNNLEDVQALMQTTQLALASMKSGLTLAASLSYSGFDTHGNHDRDHVVRLSKLLSAIDFVVAEAERQGLSQRLYIVVGSDFGRGPYYNGDGQGAGKDHWASTSALVIVPPAQAAAYGNRVIGATTDDVRAKKLVAGTLDTADSGVMLTPAVIHRSLRKLLGVEGSAGATRFPLAGDDLPLFG